MDHIRIELALERHVPEYGEGLLLGLGRTVGTLFPEGLIDIAHCENPCLGRNFLGAEAEGIAAPVQFFVVVGRPAADLLKVGDSLQQMEGMEAVLAHAQPFPFRERVWLFQDTVGDGELPQIVQKGCDFDPERFRRGISQESGHFSSVLGHSVGVPEGVGALAVDDGSKDAGEVPDLGQGDVHAVLANKAADSLGPPAGFDIEPEGLPPPQAEQRIDKERGEHLSPLPVNLFLNRVLLQENGLVAVEEHFHPVGKMNQIAQHLRGGKVGLFRADVRPMDMVIGDDRLGKVKQIRVAEELATIEAMFLGVQSHIEVGCLELHFRGGDACIVQECGKEESVQIVFLKLQGNADLVGDGGHSWGVVRKLRVGQVHGPRKGENEFAEVQEG